MPCCLLGMGPTLMQVNFIDYERRLMEHAAEQERMFF